MRKIDLSYIIFSLSKPFDDLSSSAPFISLPQRHVDHNILDCNTRHESLQPYLSNKPQKMEEGNTNWNVLAVCAIVKAINLAKNVSCD